MKTPYNLLVNACILLVLGCEAPEAPITHYVSVAIDKTEANTTPLSSDFILNTLKNSQLADGMELALLPISDIRYSSKLVFVLDKGEVGWLANEDARRGRRNHVFKRFKDSLAVLNTTQQNLKRSNIYRVIVRELNSLATKTGKRSLIISSDLKEHSFFSVYNATDVHSLFNTPKAVQSTFESVIPLTDHLSGITVVIVYKPSLKDDELFSRLIKLYTSILESRGATVTIGNANTITM